MEVLFSTQDKKINLGEGESEEDFREAATRPVGKEDQTEDEKLLSQAIELSLENEKENDEEELLKQAIALSLEM